VALTKVSPSLFQVSNNITSVTVGGSANTISLTFDSNGVITGASNNAVSVANTAITGNIISSQIASVNGSVITANTIANSAIQTGAVENYMSAQGLGFGMRNRIINGAMVIDQRNGGASINPTDGQRSVDQWRAARSQASKLTVQQNAAAVTPPVGFSNYLGVTSSSAYSITSSDYFFLFTKIEGFNTADLNFGTANASTVTLSFWVRSSLTGTFGGSLLNSAQNRSYPFTYTINAANTWEKETITIPGDTSGTWIGATNGVGLQLYFGLGVGSTGSGTAGAWAAAGYQSATGATSVVGTNGATFYITGVQLEKGSTATSFDYRPYTTELTLCQRYYQTIGAISAIGSFYDNTTLSGSFLFPIAMRSAPTVGQTGTLNFTDTGGNYTQSSTGYTSALTTSTEGYVTVSNFTGITAYRPYWFSSYNSSSKLITLDAEL
jgi:hypothetical protein